MSRTVAVKADDPPGLAQVLAQINDRLERIERALAESSAEIRDDRRDAEVETAISTIRGWIRGGKLEPGDRLDGDDRLARSLHVGKTSAALAKQELLAAGDVYKVPQGTPGWMSAFYVGKRPPWTYK